MFGETNLLRWKAAVRAARNALDGDDLPAAVRLYQDAMQEAERLLVDRCEDLPTPRMYVATCHHLAETYHRLGHYELALETLRSAHRRLVHTIRDTCLPLELRQGCVEELRHALLPLLAVLKGTAAGRQEAQRLLSEASRLVFCCAQSPMPREARPH